MQRHDESILRYKLQFDTETRVILVELNANGGCYDALSNRLIIEFESLASSLLGDDLVASQEHFSFAAMIEYEDGRVETVYYGLREPDDLFFNHMESIAHQCYFDQEDSWRYLTDCLIPEDFMNLHLYLQQLCNSLDPMSLGKFMFSLSSRAELVRDSLSNQGLLVTIDSDVITIPVPTADFKELHGLLSRVFVATEAASARITGIRYLATQN